MVWTRAEWTQADVISVCLHGDGDVVGYREPLRSKSPVEVCKYSLELKFQHIILVFILFYINSPDILGGVVAQKLEKVGL